MLAIFILSLFSARLCQHGVIGSLEKFFQWYGSLIATHPKKAILISVLITTLGGLGLFRYKICQKKYFLFFSLYTPGPWISRFMGVCTVNSSFNNIFPDFMKREMLLLWSFQDILHFEKIWIGSTQTFQERYKKNKQIEFVFLENQLRLHTLSSI